VLLRLGTDAPAGNALRTAAEQRNVPLEIVTLVDPQVIAAYERRLVLVRPDGHVAWRSDTEPENADIVIDAIRGAHASADVTPELESTS
jgi:NAD(P)H-hydrate repair Nnr-like enzyme with NAD(P)H-hydrate epimerase domain